MAIDQQLTRPPTTDTGLAVNVTWRAVIVAVICTLIAARWIDTAEVVTFFCQITEAVPAIPAVAFLIVLALSSPIIRRLSAKWALKRTEMLAVYVFLTVATSMAGPGIARFFINTVPVLFYFETPENDFASYQRFMPGWMVPHDREVIRQLYEGSSDGKIPWQPWLGPIAMWSLFFLAFWLVMMAVTVMFRRQWAEREKLIYPLLYLPLEVTDDVDGKSLLGTFFRNHIMWIGFGVAVLYNVGNVLNAYNPAMMALGKYYDLGRLFTERPLSALQPLTLHYRPEMIGFGYLVSTEVALSVWVFYLMIKLESLFAATAGLQISGFPFDQEQAMGAYIAMAGLLTWIGRHHLLSVIRKAFTGDPAIDDSDEPMTYRMAVFGGLAAFAVVIGWMVYAGMAPWLAILYTVLILMVALVYSRIRAEIGVPLIWMFPYYQQYKAIKYFLGSRALMASGEWRSATIFTTLVFMSRGYYPSLMGYQAESYRLARDVGIKPRSMSWNLVAALVVGFLVAIWLHLRSYYAYGAGGIGSLEGWGGSIAKGEFAELTGWAKAATSPDLNRIIATGSGFTFALALMALRMVFLKFPLHPLAFCMTTSYGDLIWGTFFLIWLIKSAIFKLGGMKAYRQLIPGFIGLALGHYFAAGIVYSLIPILTGGSAPEWVRRYGVWFG